MNDLKDKQLIVLLAGKGTRLYPLTYGFPKCLLSIRQKPAIYNMILPLIKKGLKDIILVVSSENKALVKEFFDNSFKNLNLNINYIIQNNIDGPGSALMATKNFINKPVILLLGDTLCTYPENYDYSWIGVNKVSNSEKSKYCMIESKNQFISKIYDKPNDKVKTDDAAIGIYFFKNPKLLKEVLNVKIKRKHDEYQISSYIELYMLREKIKLINIEDWQDIGTLENYMEVNRHSFNSRNFNTLFLDELGVIHKKSLFEKISSEMDWFKEIVNTDFEKLTPKFYNNNRFSSEYGIEYYDYLTLSEYMTFYPLPYENKQVIFKNIIRQLKKVYNKNKIISLEFNDLFKKILIDKTIKRLKDWNRKDIVNCDNITINGTNYFGVLKCLNTLTSSIEKICDDSINYTTIIHGDPAFSNILFAPRSMNFKLIDARGNFGIDTIYGDYRYDLAKLRHCYHGRYDEIVNDLFDINLTSNNKKTKEFIIKYFKELNYKEFDEILSDNEINIDDIELIEGLLFISMIPLHNDYPERQLAFFTQGIIMLNNQIKRRGL